MKLSRIKEVSPRVAIAAGALVLAVSVVSGRQFAAPESAPAADSAAAQSAPRQPRIDAGEFDLSALRREGGEAQQVVADIFAAPAPEAPAAPSEPVRAAAPAKPQVPELPFRYAGRIVDGGKAAVFLLKGDEPFSVSAGGKIDADYKLLAMTDSELTFLYLPMGARQKLSLIEDDGRKNLSPELSAPPQAPQASK